MLMQIKNIICAVCVVTVAALLLSQVVFSMMNATTTRNYGDATIVEP